MGIAHMIQWHWLGQLKELKYLLQDGSHGWQVGAGSWLGAQLELWVEGFNSFLPGPNQGCLNFLTAW